ncbi:MAG: hypothetical protein AB7T49_08550 [Oligoflexales bacterium]
MTSFHFTRLFARLRTALAIVLFLFVNSCAYRFTNLATTAPSGIRTIAVEAIYDTTREVLPHEILWSEMQKAIIENGRLDLTSRAEADALLRTHVKSFSLVPNDDALPTGKGPQITGEYKNWAPMTRAEQGSTDGGELLGLTVEVEVWDLRARKVIFKKTYASTGKIDQISRIPSLTPPDSNYLFYEESLNSEIQGFARDISSKAISDIFLQI